MKLHSLSLIPGFTLDSVIKNPTHFQQFLIRNLSLSNDTASLLLSSPVNLKQVRNSSLLQLQLPRRSIRIAPALFSRSHSLSFAFPIVFFDSRIGAC